MGKVIKIGIADTKGNKMLNVDSVQAIKGKGLQNDRMFRENPDF